MVNFAIPTIALLALAPLISAVAVPPKAEVERFSFEKWVDGIITNPEATHLTPEQAIEEWQRTVVNATESDNTLHKRARCNLIDGGEVKATEAVKCINHLASLGSQACKVKVQSRFATSGNAEIWGVGAGTKTQSSSCNDVARGAGKIMDQCWRADGKVQGSEYAYGNGNIAVHIVRKGRWGA